MEKRREWSPEMLPDSLMSNFEGKSLKDHLQETWELAKGLAERNRVPVDMEKLKWVCWTHDLGKAGSEHQRSFQRKFRGPNHAEISAWFTFSATCDLICAEAVRKHHSKIDSFADISNYWANDDFDVDEVNETISSLLPNWSFAVSQSLLDDLYDRLLPTEQILDMSAQDLAYVHDWLRLKTIYSLLVTADYMSNMGIGKVSGVSTPEFKPLNGACDDKTRQACLEQAEKVTAPAGGVYSLIVPTKLGRTAIGLEIAGKWAHTMGLSNIVYVLPDEEGSEQTVQMILDAFGPNNVQIDFGHNVTVFKTSTIRKRAEQMSQYWDAPVVVTSIKQFKRAIFGNGAGEALNFHRLSNAMVVMDNPQRLNVEELKDFGTIIDFLSQKLNSVFLLSSYMRSPIMNVAKQEIAPADLAPLHYTCQVIQDAYNIEALPALLETNIKSLYTGSGLVVLNTKQSALRAYDILKDTLGQKMPIFFVSEDMTPKHRQDVLSEMKDLEKKGHVKCVVTTQAGESGLDIDCQWAFRDIGPFDRILQVADKCAGKEKETAGEVIVAPLQNSETGQPVHKDVYDVIIMQEIRRTLEKFPAVNAQVADQASSFYYEHITDNINLLSRFHYIESGEWDKLLQKPKDKDVPLYIEIDDELQSVLEKYENIEKACSDLSAVREIMEKLRQYRVIVPKNEVQQWERQRVFSQLPNREEWILPQREIGKVYQMEKGFVPFQYYEQNKKEQPFFDDGR